MENRASYFFVGVFVFGVFFASLGFLLWLGGWSKDESFDYYEIHTQESVAGLGLKAPVRLLGVEVGSVEDISIDTKDELEVRIRIKVKKDTPIREDTFATLELQGITGLKFIQLQGGSGESEPLESDGRAYPVIQFREGFLASIDKQSERIFSLIETADAKSKVILSDENLRNFGLLLENLAQLSQNLNAHSKDLSKNLNEASKNIALAAKNLQGTLRSIDESSLAFRELMQGVSKKLEAYEALREGALENLELLRGLLLEGNKALKDLRKSPSDLIFKEGKPQLGPGEE